MIDEVRKQTELRIEQEKKIGVQEEKIRQLENEIVILKEDNLRSDLNFSQTEVRYFVILYDSYGILYESYGILYDSYGMYNEI